MNIGKKTQQFWSNKVFLKKNCLNLKYFGQNIIDLGQNYYDFNENVKDIGQNLYEFG